MVVIPVGRLWKVEDSHNLSQALQFCVLIFSLVRYALIGLVFFTFKRIQL